MIKMMVEFNNWLAKNDIDPAGVTVVIQARPIQRKHISHAFTKECRNMTYNMGAHEPLAAPIEEGRICGIPYRIESNLEPAD